MTDKVLKLIKLNSSDEILSEVEADPDNKSLLILNNPFRVYYIYDYGTFYPQLHPMIFGQFFMTTKLHTSDIIMILEPGMIMTSIYYEFIERILSDQRPKGVSLH